MIWPKFSATFLTLNDALKDVPLEDFCFVMKVLGIYVGLGAQAPLIQVE